MDFASQASIVRKFQNVKIQLHKTISHIKFIKACLRSNVIPNYARINMKGTSIADLRTKKHAEIYRINEEIRALYSKKSLLNSKLYHIHLQLLNTIHPATLDLYLDFINRRDAYHSSVT